MFLFPVILSLYPLLGRENINYLDGEQGVWQF
jgi:hypothetical protein